MQLTMTFEQNKKTFLTTPIALFAIVSILLVIIAFLATSEATANMFGIFKKHDVHLSPAVDGRLLNKGAPLSNVIITRSLAYDKEQIDTATTDQNGNFSFVAQTIKSRSPNYIFHEARIRQVISVEMGNTDYLLWYTVVQGIEEQATLTKLLANLNCDIANGELETNVPSSDYPNYKHNIHSICRWEQ